MLSKPVVGRGVPSGASEADRKVAAVHLAVQITFAAGCVAVDPAALAPIELSQFQPVNVNPVLVNPVPLARVVVLPWLRPVAVVGVVPVPPPRL